MKYLIHILVLTFCLQVISQEVKTISGVIIYKSTPNYDLDNASQKVATFFKKTIKMSKDFRFILTFNDNESLFEVEERMGNDYSPMGLRVAERLIAGGRHYTNLRDTLLIRETEVGGEELLISINIFDTNSWSITKETKVINNFKCFKAIKNKTTINSKGSFNFEIVAWFAPEIPARFGPKEFNNLPGLILELQDTHHNFYIDKIEFLKKPQKIAPFKGDIITEEEYKKITSESLNNFRERIKKN